MTDDLAGGVLEPTTRERKLSPPESIAQYIPPSSGMHWRPTETGAHTLYVPGGKQLVRGRLSDEMIHFTWNPDPTYTRLDVLRHMAQFYEASRQKGQQEHGVGEGVLMGLMGDEMFTTGIQDLVSEIVAGSGERPISGHEDFPTTHRLLVKHAYGQTWLHAPQADVKKLKRATVGLSLHNYASPHVGRLVAATTPGSMSDKQVEQLDAEMHRYFEYEMSGPRIDPEEE